MKISTMVLLACGLFGLALLSGCGDSSTAVDAQLVSQHRDQLVLESEPEVVLGITELREKLEGTQHAEDHDHADHAGHDHDGDDHAKGEHAGHDDHGEDHAGHDHDGDDHAKGEHAGHDDDGEDHAGHDHDGDDHAKGEHAGHDDDGEDHAEHDHGEHADHEHAEDDHADHEHAEHHEGVDSMSGIAVVGKISQETADGGASASDFPWEKGEAAFVMVDPATEGGEEEHQHGEGEECPFCAKKKIEAQAVVQFSAGSGTIKVDARDLFGIKVDDIVVVRGDAAVKGGVLIIDADGIYVRQ